MDDKWDIERAIIDDKLRSKFSIGDKITFNDGRNTRFGKVIRVYNTLNGYYYHIDIDNGVYIEISESMLTLQADKPVDITLFPPMPF